MLINKHAFPTRFDLLIAASKMKDVAQFTQGLLESAMAIVHPEIDDAAASPASEAVPVLFFLVYAEAGYFILMEGAVARAGV